MDFGNTNVEASTGQLSNNILGLVATSGGAGDIESISAFLAPTGTRNVKYALYRASDDSLVAQTQEIQVSGTADWFTADFASPVAVDASTSYYILAWADGSFQCTIARASQNSAGRFRGITYTTNFPDPSGTSNNNFIYSIFATYADAPILGIVRVKQSGTFASAATKARVSGTFVDATTRARVDGSWIPAP